MVFTTVKEKIQLFAEECCKVQEYQLYKDLMKEARALEEVIVGYQNELRTNIQTTQMSEYVQIGEEHMQDFYTEWEERFRVDEEEALVRVQDLQIAHEQQMEALNRKLDRAVEASKIKPDVRLKMM